MTRNRSVTGFTLIELMIVVAVVGILATIALPSFLESMRKGRRGDAVAALQQVQLAQERHRTNNPAYTDDLGALNVSARSPDGYYDIALSNVSGTGYTATATAAGSQASDSRCRVLRLVQAGGNIRYGSTDAGGVDQAAGAHNTCWNR